MDIRIRDITNDDLVEIDPYRASTRGRMAVALMIDREEVWLETYSPGQGVSPALWHGRQLLVRVKAIEGEGEIDGCALIERLRDAGSDERELLNRILAGHSVEWNGANHVGRLTADASEAFDLLQDLLEATPGTGCALWDAADFYAAEPKHGTADRLQIFPHTSDAEIAELATREITDARSNGVLLEPRDVQAYLQVIRDQQVESG